MFVVYLFTLQIQNSYLLLAISVINGFTTASFWINQGRWMQKIISPELIGRLTGVFWMLYNSSSLIGNTSSFLMTRFATISTNLLIWCLAGVAIVGLLMLLFMSDAPKTSDSGTVIGRCRNLIRLKDHRPSLLLAPYSIGMGISGAFNYGCIPSFITMTMKSSGTNSISQAFIFYGLGATIGSYTFGRLFDKYGWKTDLVSNVVSLGIVTVLSTLLSLDLIPHGGVSVCFFLLLLFGGLNDSVSNCLINISVSKVYIEELSASGWTCFRVFFCLGYSSFMFSSPSFSFQTSLIASCALQLLGIVSYYFFGKLCLTESQIRLPTEVALKHVSFDTLPSQTSESGCSKTDIQVVSSGISRSVSMAEFRKGDVHL